MKLVFEYEGKKYRLEDDGDIGFCFIATEEGDLYMPLNVKFCRFKAEEEKKHEMDYWWESQVSLAKRAMEKEGAKILEFEDEEVETVDEHCNPLLF